MLNLGEPRLILNHRDKYSHHCAAAGAAEIYRCRTLRSIQFVIDYCPCDQVISIRSAVVGYNRSLQSNNRQTYCRPLKALKPCEKSATDRPAIMHCNGKRACWIPQSVLNYSVGDKLCTQHQNGNFIAIKYDCVNPGKRKCCL